MEQKYVLEYVPPQKADLEVSLGTASYDRKKEEPYVVCPKDRCTGCGACINCCPNNAMVLEEDEEGFFYPKIPDESLCTKCGLCEKICPVLSAGDMTDRKPQHIYAAFHLDEEIRYESTSGGAFSALAECVFKMSGVCYGAAYDEDFNVRHVRIDDMAKLHRIRQSKYYQSDVGHTYREVRNDLFSGRYVLFCGTPCQCAGLASYLGKEYDRLLCVDFICHSICSPKAFRAYKKDLEMKYGGSISRVWFKNKETTWEKFSVRVDFEGKDGYYRRIQWEDPFFRGFLHFFAYLRPSCHACTFKGYRRTSDITLADFWGLEWKNENFGEEEKKDGVSLVMINSDKGQRFFDDFVRFRMYSEEHDFDEIVKKNGGYFHSMPVGWRRDCFFEYVDKIPFGELIEAFEEDERRRKGQSS